MTDDSITEPDWLAAEPSDRAKLTAIMAAIRRCYAECPVDAHPSGPHISTSMAELFIGRMLMEAAAAERERIRSALQAIIEGWNAQEDLAEHPVQRRTLEDCAGDVADLAPALARGSGE